MDKYSLFTKLVNFLIDGQTETGGWGNEPGPYKESNPLNTGEVLLGLLLAGDHLVNIMIPKDYSKSVESGVKYLLNTQLESGGWATGSAYLASPITASGNVVSTCISLWALVEYLKRNHRNIEVKDCINNGFEFIRSCIRDNTCVYSPSLEMTSTVASAYCVFALSLMFEVLSDKKEIIEQLMKDILSDIEIDFQNDCDYKVIVSLLSFIAIKLYTRSGKTVPRVISSFYGRLKAYIEDFDEKIVTNSLIEKQVIREIGKAKRDYTHYIPFWYSVAMLIHPEVIKSKQLANAFYKISANIDNADGGVVIGGKGLTWATGQTLMAYCYYFDTVDINNILSIEGFNMVDRRKVFVVYGRNIEFKNKMFEYLRLIGLTPLEWEKLVDNGAPFTFDVVVNGFKQAQAVLVLLTGDDEGKCLDTFILDDDDAHERTLTPQPRLNVIFEAGMAMALYRDRTIVVKLDKQRKFTDIYGVNCIGLDKCDTISFKTTLNSRLKQCGCELIDTQTTSDWIKFEF